MLHAHICMHRQKIIVSAAELAIRPSVHPSLLETFIFGLESAKKGIGTCTQESTGFGLRTCSLALPCLAPGYIPDPTLARYLRGKIEIKTKQKLGFLGLGCKMIDCDETLDNNLYLEQ